MKISLLLMLLVMPLVLQAAEISADKIMYDPDGEVKATGHVRVTAKAFEIQASAMNLDLDSQAGAMENASVHFYDGYTLKGEHLQRIDLERFEGKDVRFSSCPEDDIGWEIVADEALLDREGGMFTAKRAWFEWGGVPVLYVPRWQHALTRRSGLLTPQLLQSSRRGTEIVLPFYWAGAPNWDMTYAPAWMSLRGLMSDVEWRHRSQKGNEMVQVRTIFDKEIGRQRSRIRSQMDWNITSALQVNLDIDSVDDSLHVADFPLLNELESTAYLTSTAAMQWQEGRDSVVLSARYQQLLGGSSSLATLQVLPRLQTRHYFDIGTVESVLLEHQSTSFHRNLGVSGTRIGIRPSWSVPWQFYDGAIAAQWAISGQVVGYDSDSFVSRSSSYAALASSMQLTTAVERILEGKDWRHEIKPVLRWDVSSAPNQSDQPQYDSRLLPLNMSNILHGNRYSGWDRFERMGRLSLLLSSSLQQKQAQSAVRTVLKAQFGVVWDYLQQSVDAAFDASAAGKTSNALVEVEWAPSKVLQLYTGGQYSPRSSRWVESHMSANWTGKHRQYLNVSWRKTDSSHSIDSELLGIKAEQDLDRHWSLSFTGQHDVLRGQILEAKTALSYQHACWNMMVELFQTYQVGSDGLSDEGARFLLAFDGLGSFGDK